MNLQITGLSKRYPSGVQALTDVSLTIQPGMFGLLGRNGAGKSTLMRILATLQEADSGRVTLGDLDVLRDKAGVRRLLGYLPQEFGVYPKTSAEDLLDHLARCKGLTDRSKRRDAVAALLQRTNLWDVRKRPLGSFSGGMKQRFGIAQALIGDPRLLIVDEPTAGLDPEERVRFHNLLSEIGDTVLVILSTHIVSDVMDLCRQMAILHGGRVIASGAPEELTAALRGQIWGATIERADLAAYQQKHTVISTRLRYGQTLIHVRAPESPGAEFHSIEPELEDAYFAAVYRDGSKPGASEEKGAEHAAGGA